MSSSLLTISAQALRVKQELRTDPPATTMSAYTYPTRSLIEPTYSTYVFPEPTYSSPTYGSIAGSDTNGSSPSPGTIAVIIVLGSFGVSFLLAIPVYLIRRHRILRMQRIMRERRQNAQHPTLMSFDETGRLAWEVQVPGGRVWTRGQAR